MKMRTAIAAAAAIVMVSGAVAEEGKADKNCSCENLESLQQEVENAGYMVRFMQELSVRLDAIEQAQIRINNGDPTNPDHGRSPLAVSKNAREQIMQPVSKGGLFDPPHPQVTGYTGPETVDMEAPSCEQNPRELEKMREGSPCKEIAEITLRHEEIHRNECKAAGPDVYWARLPSGLAAEESERYAQQAKEMRDLLKRVLDNSELSMQSRTEMFGKASGFDGEWVFTTEKAVLTGESSPGADDWTLAGRTTGTNRMTKAIISGEVCTPSGEFRDEVAYQVVTDGLSISAIHSGVSAGGGMRIACSRGGWNMHMEPKDIGTGPVFNEARLESLMSVSVDVNTTPMLKIFEGAGMVVTGTYTATLTCTPK